MFKRLNQNYISLAPDNSTLKDLLDNNHLYIIPKLFKDKLTKERTGYVFTLVDTDIAFIIHENTSNFLLSLEEYLTQNEYQSVCKSNENCSLIEFYFKYKNKNFLIILNTIKETARLYQLTLRETVPVMVYKGELYNLYNKKEDEIIEASLVLSSLFNEVESMTLLSEPIENEYNISFEDITLSEYEAIELLSRLEFIKKKKTGDIREFMVSPLPAFSEALPTDKVDTFLDEILETNEHSWLQKHTNFLNHTFAEYCSIFIGYRLKNNTILLSEIIDIYENICDELSDYFAVHYIL